MSKKKHKRHGKNNGIPKQQPRSLGGPPQQGRSIAQVTGMGTPASPAGRVAGVPDASTAGAPQTVAAAPLLSDGPPTSAAIVQESRPSEAAQLGKDTNVDGLGAQDEHHAPDAAPPTKTKGGENKREAHEELRALVKKQTEETGRVLERLTQVLDRFVQSFGQEQLREFLHSEGLKILQDMQRQLDDAEGSYKERFEELLTRVEQAGTRSENLAKELADGVEDYEGLDADIRRKISMYRPAHIELLEQQKKALETECTDLRSQIQDIRRQLDDAGRQIALNQLEGGRFSLQFVEKLQKDYEAIRTENVDLMEQVRTQSREIEKQQHQIADMGPDFQVRRLSAQEQRELGELRQWKLENEPKLRDQEATRRDLEAESDRLSARNKALGKQVREQKERIERIEALEVENSQLRQEKEEVSKDLKDLDAENRRLSDQVNKLLSQSSVLRSERDAARDERDQVKAALREGEASLRRTLAVEYKVEMQRQADSASRKATAQLKEEYDRRLEEKAAQIDAQHELVDSLETRCHDLQGKVQTMMAEQDAVLARAREQESKLRSKIAALNDARETAEAELERTVKQDQHLRDRANEVQKEIASAQGRRDALAAELEQFQSKAAVHHQREAAAWRPLFEGRAEPESFEHEAVWLKRTETAIRAAGFRIGARLLYAFHTSLKCQDISPLTLLAGISGTGKSELPRLYAHHGGLNFHLASVQPNWDNPMDLFGFFSYTDGYFKATDLSRAMNQFVTRESPYNRQLLLVLLDEMNLARVEYYFSDLLSRLEARRSLLGRKNITSDERRQASIELDEGKAEPRRMFLDTNVLFVGTLNQDESTLDLSDKVLDRANVLTFPRPSEFVSVHQANGAPGIPLSRDSWNAWCQVTRDDLGELTSELNATFKEINRALAFMNRGIGQRVFQAVLKYISLYPAQGKSTEALVKAKAEAIEDQFAMKIIPKLKGVETGTKQGKACLEGMRKVIPDSLRSTFEESYASNLFDWRGSNVLFEAGSQAGASS